jgi:hypothetical protein
VLLYWPGTEPQQHHRVAQQPAASVAAGDGQKAIEAVLKVRGWVGERAGWLLSPEG